MTLDNNKIKKPTTAVIPFAGKRIHKFDLKNSKIQGVPKGFLNASIPDWTDPAQLVKKITQNKMDKNTADDALEQVRQGFEAVGNSKNQQLARYGVNCLNYITY